MREESPVPFRPRWSVWTDDRTDEYLGATMTAARWFWAASGPRGHASGAEDKPEEAVRRAQLAAMQLDTSQRRDR